MSRINGGTTGNRMTGSQPCLPGSPYESADTNIPAARETLSRVGHLRHPFGASKADDPALQANRHGMRPIVGGQLRQDVLDVPLDRVFRKRKPIGDELIGVPSRNQPQDLYLASGQR